MLTAIPLNLFSSCGTRLLRLWHCDRNILYQTQQFKPILKYKFSEIKNSDITGTKFCKTIFFLNSPLIPIDQARYLYFSYYLEFIPTRKLLIYQSKGNCYNSFRTTKLGSYQDYHYHLVSPSCTNLVWPPVDPRPISLRTTPLYT